MKKNKITIISIETPILLPTSTPLGKKGWKLSIKTKSATRQSLEHHQTSIQGPDFLIAKASLYLNHSGINLFLKNVIFSLFVR